MPLQGSEQEQRSNQSLRRHQIELMNAQASWGQVWGIGLHWFEFILDDGIWDAVPCRGQKECSLRSGIVTASRCADPEFQVSDSPCKSYGFGVLGLGFSERKLRNSVNSTTNLQLWDGSLNSVRYIPEFRGLGVSGQGLLEEFHLLDL